VTTVRLLRWTLSLELETTRECYDRVLSVDVADCACDGCRNFRALRDHDFPPAFLATLTQLGVPLRKPAEVTSYGPDGSGLHIYQLVYHAAGRLEHGRDGWKQVVPDGWTADFESLAQHVGVGVTTRLCLVPVPFRDRDLIQFEFDLRLPWVLDEPYVETVETAT
jgi:hypothetical protein